jgi:hypothetical protein
MPVISEPQHAILGAATAGFNTLVAAVAGKRILVENYNLSSAGVVLHRWFSGTTTALTGTANYTTTSYVNSGYCPSGHFMTAAGESLVGSMSASVVLQGHLTYRLVGTL